MSTQTQEENRISFLREFTKAILLSIEKEKRLKEEIEIEKLKQKLIESEKSKEIFKDIIKRKVEKDEKKEIEKQETEPSIFTPYEKRKNIIYRVQPKTLKKSFLQPLKPQLKQEENYVKSKFTKPVKENIPQRIVSTEDLTTQTTSQINLFENQEIQKDPFKKLEPLLKDKTVLLIECPGPGKNILVKRYNQKNITRIVLSQSEISKIINEFSEKARIPIIGGILKAAVDNLIISAVVSEYVGSRFVITKLTPYSIIEKK